MVTKDSKKCQESRISPVLYDCTTTQSILLLHLLKLESAASMQLVHLPCMYAEALAVFCEIVGACRLALIHCAGVVCWGAHACLCLCPCPRLCVSR